MGAESVVSVGIGGGGGSGVEPSLTQIGTEIKHLAAIVDGTPQPVALAVDRHDHLVEMPVITGPRAQAPEVRGDAWTELEEPAPDRLVGNVDAAFGYDLLGCCQSNTSP